jgi:hypothetical protein
MLLLLLLLLLDCLVTHPLLLQPSLEHRQQHGARLLAVIIHAAAA